MNLTRLQRLRLGLGNALQSPHTEHFQRVWDNGLDESSRPPLGRALLAEFLLDSTVQPAENLAENIRITFKGLGSTTDGITPVMAFPPGLGQK